MGAYHKMMQTMIYNNIKWFGKVIRKACFDDTSYQILWVKGQIYCDISYLKHRFWILRCVNYIYSQVSMLNS
jgi:hypothetical protein